MKKYILLFLLFLLSAISTVAQEKIDAIETGHQDMSADFYVGFDTFGFQYAITDNTLVKANERGKLEFKKISYGRIARVDITNPLLIVIFYEDFNSVVLLDNQLNEVRTINFNDLDVSGQQPLIVRAVGLASQNRLWIYDALTKQIGLFNFTNATYRVLSTPISDNIKYYQTDYNYFQWADAKGDWYACDNFGKVTTLGKVPDHDIIRFTSGQSFLYTKDGTLFYRNLKNNGAQVVSGLNNSPKNFYSQPQNLAIFTSSGITNYKINLP